MSARWAGPWWTSGCICRRAGPRTKTGVRRRGFRRRGRDSKTELALEMLGRVLERGHLRAGWVAGDDRYVAVLPGGTSGSGDVVRAGRSRRHQALGAGLNNYQGFGRPKAQAGGRTAADHGAAQRRIAGGCLAGDNGGGGIPGAEEPYVQRPAGAGNQEAQARRDGLGRLPPEPRYYLSNAPYPVGAWHTWEVGALRPSSRRRRATWGWTSTRPGGRDHHQPAGRSFSAEPATFGLRSTGWCGNC